MTPTLATIRFESAYLLCHVNAIDAHPMRIQFDSLWLHIETGLQRASCERPFYIQDYNVWLCLPRNITTLDIAWLTYYCMMLLVYYSIQ